MSRGNFELLELLYKAYNSPSGIVVRTSSFDRLRQQLYSTRKSANDDCLASLSFVQSPNDAEHELWIVKKS